MAFDFGSLAAKYGPTLLGGVLGAASNSGSGKANETTASRDPWAPAQPYILDNLKSQSELQDYYRKTPFNAQQQAGYNNLFGDADYFRESVAPGLLGFANDAMGGSYERQRGGSLGDGAGYGGLLQPGGRSAGRGPFSVNPNAQKFGMMDFAKTNPYTNGAIVAPKPADTAALPGGGMTVSDAQYRGGNGGGRGDDGYGGLVGIGVTGGDLSPDGTYTGLSPDVQDKINQDALDMGMKASLIGGPLAGIIAGLVSMGLSTAEARAAVESSGLVNATSDGGVGMSRGLLNRQSGGSLGGGFGDNGGAGYGAAPSGHPDHAATSGGGMW